MKTTAQYLICCVYGKDNDARSVPILVVPTESLAVSITMEMRTNPDGEARQLALNVLGKKALPADIDFSVQNIQSIVPDQGGKTLLTKEELRCKLLDGACMGDLFEFTSGQECEIFKADAFAAGPQILYIPDTFLNEIPVSAPVNDSMSLIDSILDSCYTGDDFIEECGGNAELAVRLFNYCDWQHPSSALSEADDEDDNV